MVFLYWIVPKLEIKFFELCSRAKNYFLQGKIKEKACNYIFGLPLNLANMPLLARMP